MIIKRVESATRQFSLWGFNVYHKVKKNRMRASISLSFGEESCVDINNEIVFLLFTLRARK